MSKSSAQILARGVIAPPAIAINGVVKFMGKVPDVGVVEKLIRKGTTGRKVILF